MNRAVQGDIVVVEVFDEKEWTAKRWSSHGVLTVKMKHLRWQVVSFVLRYMCAGEEDQLFETLGVLRISVLTCYL